MFSHAPFEIVGLSDVDDLHLTVENPIGGRNFIPHCVAQVIHLLVRKHTNLIFLAMHDLNGRGAFRVVY